MSQQKDKIYLVDATAKTFIPTKLMDKAYIVENVVDIYFTMSQLMLDENLGKDDAFIVLCTSRLMEQLLKYMIDESLDVSVLENDVSISIPSAAKVVTLEELINFFTSSNNADNDSETAELISQSSSDEVVDGDSA